MDKFILGLGCMKFHQISISDKLEIAPIIVQNQEVELVQSDGLIYLSILINVKELDLIEVWKVGVSNKTNSSEYLEPFDLEIIRISSEEFIIRISATCNISNSNDYLFTLELFSKFNYFLPKQLEGLDSFYDLAY